MSTTIVQARYDALEQISGRFRTRSELTAELLGRVRADSQTLLADGWQGRGAQAFQHELETLVLPVTQRLVDALAAADQTLRAIGALLQEAERSAAAVFQTQAVAGLTLAGAATTAAALLGGLMKGIALDALLPRQFVLRALTPDLTRGKTTVAMLMDMLAGKPGKGLPLIRFDGPHGGSPFPHININPQLTGVKDPHIPISPALLDAAGKTARVLETAGKVAVPVAVATDVFRLGSAFHADGDQIGANTKRTAGSVAGGWAGAWAGGEAGAAGGAMLGGALGTIVPGVGNVVGAGVGGLIGGLGGAIGGALGGSAVGEWLGGLL